MYNDVQSSFFIIKCFVFIVKYKNKMLSAILSVNLVEIAVFLNESNLLEKCPILYNGLYILL